MTMTKEDQELVDIFHGDKPMHPDTIHVTLGKPNEEKKAIKKETPVTAQWQPVKPDLNWMGKLKSCVTLSVPFAVLTSLVFYWEHAELMAESIAVPSMLFCACMVGLGIGMVVRK